MNNLKIISGIYRGRSIKSPKSSGTHPMGSREKLALFNMLSSQIDGAIVFDAYAGSGALGIEAISRGAKKVLFIENNHAVMHNLIENTKILGIPEEKVLFRSEKIEAFLEKNAMLKQPKMANIIIADPPYDKFSLEPIINLTKYLEDGGILVLSHPGDTPEINGLKLTKSHNYAAATISIYQK